MDLSKQSELQNGMGLRNHVIEFFVFFLKSLSLGIKGPSQDYTARKEQTKNPDFLKTRRSRF